MLKNIGFQNLSNEIDRIKKENDSLQLELRSSFFTLHCHIFPHVYIENI